MFEALAAALVALVIVIYQSRPRGWCNHNLVQVCPCTLTCVLQRLTSLQ